MLINAAVCGAVSGAFPRYQARVVWLLPLAALLFVVDGLLKRTETVSAGIPVRAESRIEC
jgi:hypothetical protein